MENVSSVLLDKEGDKMKFRERDTFSFYRAVVAARKYKFKHYLLGGENQFLIVQVGEEIKMFKDIGI